MVTIAFQAQITNGMIEVPEIYRKQLPESVQVIVVATPRPQATGILDRLLHQPLHDPGFRPFTREEIYADRLK